MGKREYRSAGVLIILLVVALLAARHFSARRLRVPAVVSPVSDISLSEEPPVEDAIAPAEEEQATEKSVLYIPAIPQAEKKEEIPHPDWFKKILALYESYYPSWQSGKSVASVASVPHTGSTVSNQKPVTPSSVASSGTMAAMTSSNSPAGNTSSHLASVKPTTPSSSGLSGGSSSGSNVPDGGGQESDNSGDEGESGDSEEEENEEEEEEEPDSQTVMVERTISSSGGTASVTLKITVNTSISGLIITENIPGGYTITSASPNYFKKSGGSYTWLMYGQSVQSQTITYQVSGTGGGIITGVYRSRKGSGTIRGSGTI